MQQCHRPRKKEIKQRIPPQRKQKRLSDNRKVSELLQELQTTQYYQGWPQEKIKKKGGRGEKG